MHQIQLHLSRESLVFAFVELGYSLRNLRDVFLYQSLCSRKGSIVQLRTRDIAQIPDQAAAQ